MLYVAGEILIWMVLAGLLGLLLGWFIWGYRSKAEAERAERETQQRVAAAQQQADPGPGPGSRSCWPSAPGTPRPSPGCRPSPPRPTRPTPPTPPRRPRPAPAGGRAARRSWPTREEERAEAEQRADAAEDILEEHEGWEPVGEIPGMEEAHQLLGKPVIMDDLKMVEGVGPKVEEVLHGAGITTWAQLADVHARPAARRPRRRRPAVQRARPDDVAPAGHPRPRRPLGGAQGAPGEPRAADGRSAPCPRPTGIRRSGSDGGRDLDLAGGTGGVDAGRREAAGAEGQQDAGCRPRRARRAAAGPSPAT